jgi:hypothetical protein
LSSRSLTDPCRKNITHNDFIHFTAAQVDSCQSLFDDSSAQRGSCKLPERAIETAYWSANGTNNNGLSHAFSFKLLGKTFYKTLRLRSAQIVGYQKMGASGKP